MSLALGKFAFVSLITSHVSSLPTTMRTASRTDGLLLDLRGSEYVTGSTQWTNRVDGQPGASVDTSIQFDQAEKAFFFTDKKIITVPLKTNPAIMPALTYAAWVKAEGPFSNKAWILSQWPDYGWSRAVTLNDERLGYTSITVGNYWNSNLGPAPIGEWFHIVGVWQQSVAGGSTVYLNGQSKASFTAHNGARAANQANGELFVIGGRGYSDGGHNSNTMISDVLVFDRALSSEEVKQLYEAGRPSALPTPAPTPAPTYRTIPWNWTENCTQQVCSNEWTFYYEALDKQTCKDVCASGYHGWSDIGGRRCTHFTFTEEGVCVLYAQCAAIGNGIPIPNKGPLIIDSTNAQTCTAPWVPPT